MAKKCCHCSSFFSCFTCFSRNTHYPVDSSESATNPADASANTVPIARPESQSSSSATNLADASANTVPVACPESQSSSSANVAVNSNVSPAAATEEADQRRDDPVRTSSASAPPFQTSTSQEASSSSATTYTDVSDTIGNIHKAAQGDNGNVNLEDLIQHISELLELIKKNERDKRRRTDNHWPKSSGFLKLKEVLSEGTEAASSLIPTTQSLLKGIGQAHWATAGLLVVANILERFEDVSANRDECLSLLKEMSNLAKYVKQLKERTRLRDGIDDLIQEALEMIVKASIMCCVQINSSKFSRFFSTTVDKKELVESQQELEKLYKRMKTRFDICLYDAITCREFRPPTTLAREYPTYAVGIEEPIREVVELLEWESQKNAVAVIVYGFGGVGKSTLADAVFARLDIVGCKYSMVRLFDDITSTPNIVELQKRILSDLMVGTEEEKKPILEVIRTFEAGQREIRSRLEKEVAFLYVDNALEADRLQQLLPSDMDKAKKVRVLITARDMGVRTVCKGCKMEPKQYAMNVLPTSEARSLLERELNEGQIESSQMDQILEICGGIPKLLTVVARFISSEEDKQKAFRIVKEETQHLNGQALGDIERYVFAYDRLPNERCKDLFLDICVFFKGLEWDFVPDVVGESELNILEKRALVSKDRYMDLVDLIEVHDVILMIGTKRAQETRFNFTDANESLFQEFLEKDISGIQGLWFGGYINPLEMPATKLDSMSNSLRILRLGDLKVKGKCEKRFEKLMFFQGEVAGLPFSISQIMTSNLKHMELNGRGSSHDFEIPPSDLQRLRNLRVLRLIDIQGWRNLPSELGEKIHGLRELTLSGCTSIEEIPRSISKLQNLRVLKMNGCDGLRRLPENIGSLGSLQNLDLSECTSIEEIPSSISKLQDLRVLNMFGCYGLRRLPEDIGSLSSLQNLDLSHCKHIEELPESTSKLRSLKELHMRFCENLKLLPKGFESLDSLRVLSLYGCKGLQIVPEIAEKFRKIIDYEESKESCTIM